MNIRQFTLIGERLIECDQPCPKGWPSGDLAILTRPIGINTENNSVVPVCTAGPLQGDNRTPRDDKKRKVANLRVCVAKAKVDNVRFTEE